MCFVGGLADRLLGWLTGWLAVGWLAGYSWLAMCEQAGEGGAWHEASGLEDRSRRSGWGWGVGVGKKLSEPNPPASLLNAFLHN